MKYLLLLLIAASAFATGETRFPNGTINYGSAAIGTQSPATSSSALDVVSTTKGFTAPRMSTTQKNAISSPATGLLVYDTTLNQMSIYNGSTWQSAAYDGNLVRTNQANTYTSGPQSLGSQVLSVQLPNDTGTGTTAHKLAKINSSGNLVIMATTDTSGAVGVVVAGAGTSGSADISQVGQATCVFDGATTAGDYVQISSGTAGDCTDAGAILPTTGQVIGRVLSTNGSGGTYAVSLQLAGGAAGVTPTIQGQSEGSSHNFVNLIAPYNQATNTGTSTYMIETGNRNLLLNPSFENVTATTSWTTTKNSGTTFTSAVDSTNFHDGKQSVKLSATSATGCLSQDVTPSIQMSGTNLEYGAWVKTSATDVQVCARQGGSTVGTCTPAPSTNLWTYVPVNYPGPSSGSVGVSVCNTATNTETFNVDEAYVGEARNLGVQNIATDWSNNLSFTFDGITTSANNMWSRRVGDTLEITGTVTVSGTSATTAAIDLPTTITIDSSKLPSLANTTVIGTMAQLGHGASTYDFAVGNTSGMVNQEGSVYSALFYDGSTTSKIYIARTTSTAALNKENASAFINTSSTVLAFNGKIPVVGWSSSQSFVSPNNNYPTFSVNTSTTAATTSSPFVFSNVLNDSNGGYSASTGKYTIPVGQGGMWHFTTGVYSASTNVINIEDNGSTICESAQPASSSTFPVTACDYPVSAGDLIDVRPSANATAAGGANLTYFSGYRVITSQAAPILVGSLTISGAGQYYNEVTYVACSSGGCTPTNQIGSAVNTVSRSSAGSYTVNFTNTAATHACIVTDGPSGLYTCNRNGAPTSSSMAVTCGVQGVSNDDQNFDLYCVSTH